MRPMIRAILTAICLAALSSTANADYTICAFGQIGAPAPTHNFQSLRLPSGRETRQGVSAGNGPPTRARAYAPFSAAETLEISFCGPWLDITSSVDVSGAGIRVDRILDKGVVGRGRVDPGMTARTERPYVTVRFIVQASAEPGARSVRLRRPSLTGGDTTTFQIDLQRNIRLHEPQRRPVFLDLANATLDHRFSISGQGLNTWVRGVKSSLPAGPLEQLRIVSRQGDSITFTARARENGGTIRHAQFFADYLELTTGTVVVHPVDDARRGADFLRARDSSAEGTSRPVQAQRPITTEGASGEEGPGSAGGGGAVLPGRPARSTGATTPPPRARTTAPDLAVQIGSHTVFTGAFDIHETNRLGLCPDAASVRRSATDATDRRSPTVKRIPNLSISVTNFGSAASPPSTLSFDRGTNSNFDRNLAFQVPSLAPGESRTFEIERKDNRVCSTHDCRRCADGIHLGRFIPTIIDEKGKVETKPANPPDQIFYWNDRGVTASLGDVAGDTNTANNSATVR